jgi:selenocysteine-specific elongation factor
MKSIVIGTAGHIDHGKSALVKALTGTDPDRLKEEQARGITIDLGFAHWTVGDLNLAFVDVPGHERFVRNMLAGVGGIDLVMLVVAADESVMPQTREHFEICRLLRIPDGVVVLTKADLVDAETIELVRLETRELVAGSFLEDAPVVAVSAKTGEGLRALGETLVARGRASGGRTTEGAARLPVDRVFTMKGFGTVVTGTLVSGEIRAEQELELLPASRRVKVRGAQVHGQRVEQARAGQRVAVNVSGVELAEVARGDSIVAPGAFRPTRVLDAIIEVVPGARGLRHGARVRFHQGTAEVLGRVAISGAAGEGAQQEAARLEEISAGARGYVRVRLESAAVLTRGDRFILRSYSPPVTVAGGQVLDPQPPRSGIRTVAGMRRFAALDGGTARGALGGEEAEERAIARMVEEAGAGGLRQDALVSRVGLAPGRMAATVARLASAGTVTTAGDVLVTPAVLESLKTRLQAILREYHRAEPLSDGLPREEARERLFAHAGPGVFERVLADLVNARRIQVRDRLALAGHRVALSADEERARGAIERAFLAAGLKPPDLATVAGASGLGGDVADRVVKLLQRQHVLVRIDTLLFHEDALKRLRGDVAAFKAAAGGGQAVIDVGTFKERYGISRKFAIPLLEYLDREHLTRRMGDVRVVV